MLMKPEGVGGQAPDVADGGVEFRLDPENCGSQIDS